MNTIKTDLEKALMLCKGAFLSAAGFSLLINFLMIAPSIYMLQVYDRVVTTGNTTTLLMLTLIILVLFITMASLEWVRSQILVRVSTRLEVLLNVRLFRVAFKQALFSGGRQATTQALDDLTGLRQFLTGSGLFAFFDAPWMPVYLALLFLFHPWFGWFSIFTAILLSLVAVATEKATTKTLSEANDIAIATRGLLSKNLRNAEVIESMGMLGNLRRRWMEGSLKVLDLQAVASSRAGLLTALSKVIRLSSQSLILGLGAYLTIEREISGGLMIAGSILMGRALAPIDLMIGSWKGFISARGQYQRLNEILQQIPDEKEHMQLPDPEGRIQLENAIVTPPGSKTPVIKGLNLVIEKGDIVGVIGPSGAGKSTLARAILGIWPTVNGAIRLDGAEVFNWDREHLGGFIGYLPQDVELFEGTISENIARFGEIDPEKVVEAAKMADVHELILRFPEGYDTVIGATGGNLSGGQRQRIGLARALYGNPVLVVLDEPNSNLDEQGESALENALLHLKQKQTTVIIVTHRNNVLTKVDKLLILNDGVLVVYGPRVQVIEYLQQQQKQQQVIAPVA
ncbi:type I secretion system permease/ATPase [Methylomicrobium sp. Wu6]|uniref:type I secretion system permease/ATPase n=1 Tax=Methylomicrobium sp. Wu6 TaxID=3107928 RepID=UPI002DD63699|nr:type I secretion system permease/ATPase [Methylomicrobium sp. Wu6]MEC4747740.1 type I secretion system permease/ATPase [Methylomicrobium sp. Wu6]